jgi:DNA repair exonuclease SbcCD ATPase subunit
MTKEKAKINKDNSHQLEGHIAQLEARLADLQSRLPAHSIPPNLIAEIDEIDELISKARSNLTNINSNVDK